jgi:2',3'-cyclic-nucleotide 2'-phosphodiesterase (5'-nucleotidase family)
MNSPTLSPGLKCACCIALLILAGCASTSPDRSTFVPLRVLHWNDFHARNIPYDVTDSAAGERHMYKVGGTGNLLGFMHRYRAQAPNVLVLNAGDDFQGTPVSGLTNGKSQITLINLIQPDAAVPGNHEFDYGKENLRDALKNATYPVIGANLFDSSQSSTFVPPTIVKQVGKLRVGIIGALPPDLPNLTMKQNLAQMSMLDIDSVVTYHSHRLRSVEKANIVIVLSHMGLGPDTLLAMRHPEVDLIVGGHSHIPLFAPIRKNRVSVVQAGSWGRYLGVVDLVCDVAGDSVTSVTGQLVETRLGVVPVDSTAARKADELEAIVARELEEVIGTLEVEWRRSLTSESNVGNWTADVLREVTGSDVALVNSGTLRINMRPGPIRKRDIWTLVPFNNTFVTITVTGDSLRKMLEWQAAGKGEFMQVSGLRYVYDPRLPAGAGVLEAYINGKDIEPQRAYTIATNNYVAGHCQELLGISPAPASFRELAITDRTMYIEYIQKKKTISSQIDGRVKNLASPEPKYDKID